MRTTGAQFAGCRGTKHRAARLFFNHAWSVMCVFNMIKPNTDIRSTARTRRKLQICIYVSDMQPPKAWGQLCIYETQSAPTLSALHGSLHPKIWISNMRERSYGALLCSLQHQLDASLFPPTGGGPPPSPKRWYERSINCLSAPGFVTKYDPVIQSHTQSSFRSDSASTTYLINNALITPWCVK